MKIAIDGTAASGKGTLAKNLAEKFDYVVENDILDKSYKEVFKLVNNFINE